MLFRRLFPCSPAFPSFILWFLCFLVSLLPATRQNWILRWPGSLILGWKSPVSFVCHYRLGFVAIFISRCGNSNQITAAENFRTIIAFRRDFGIWGFIQVTLGKPTSPGYFCENEWKSLSLTCAYIYKQYRLEFIYNESDVYTRSLFRTRSESMNQAHLPQFDVCSFIYVTSITSWVAEQIKRSIRILPSSLSPYRHCSL